MPAEGKWVYVIPLSRIYWGKRVNRADRAIRFIRSFVARHTKAERVIIMNDLAEKIWSRSRQRPPRRVKVIVDIKEEKEGEKTVKIAKVSLGAEKLSPGKLGAGAQS